MLEKNIKYFSVIIMKKDVLKKIFTIPNILTMFRLVLIIPIVITYFANDNNIATIILVAISAFTDVIDGIIARKFNMVSELGKILDPIADKLTQLALTLCLCFSFPLMIIPCALLVVKEVVSGIFGIYVVRKLKHNLFAEWHGKLATVTLYGIMLAHLVWPDIDKTLSMVLIIISSSLMLLSFILYLLRYRKLIKGIKESEKVIQEESNN